MCELLVGLPDVNIEGVGEWPSWLRIAITTRSARPSCPTCGGVVWHHDDLDVELVDLPCFRRRTRLVWCKSRWRWVKRVAFGIMNWTNYRTRSLLDAGKPNWSLLGIYSR